MKFSFHTVDTLRDLYVNRDEPERFHTLANSYWRLLLLVVASITVCALLYGVWELTAIMNPPAASNATKPAPDVLNRVQLQAVLDGFAAREAAYNKLKDNPPRAVDPAN